MTPAQEERLGRAMAILAEKENDRMRSVCQARFNASTIRKEAILEMLETPQTVRDVAEATHISRETAHGILANMIASGTVRYEFRSRSGRPPSTYVRVK